MMDIQKIRDTLGPIILNQPPPKTSDEAIRGIAVALLQMAEGIQDLRIALGGISRAPQNQVPT